MLKKTMNVFECNVVYKERNQGMCVATSFNFGPKNSEPHPRRMKMPQRRRTCILNLERGEFISLICVTRSN